MGVKRSASYQSRENMANPDSIGGKWNRLHFDGKTKEYE